VIGLVESAKHAQQAIRDLEQAGFRSNVTLVDQNTPQLRERLVQAGVPEQDAQLYAQGIGQNHPLIVLQGLDASKASQAADVLDRHHLIDISSLHTNYDRSQTTRDTSRTGQTNLYQGGSVAIPIIEEHLEVSKREVERGGVRVNTRVEETPVNEQVTLHHEKVEVERHRVDRPVSASDLDAVREGSFEVRERAEEAVVNKQARVTEEVVIGKSQHEHTKTIQDTVRRTDVDVEQVAGQTREVGGTSSQTNTSNRSNTDEGMIERGVSKAENAVERGTGADLDRDGDVGRRDPRNNI